MRVTARAIRPGQWWAVEVPEAPGLFTQVRRLDHVPSRVADAVELLEGVPAASVQVSRLPVLDAGVDDAAREAAKAAIEAQTVTSRSLRSAVARLRDEQLTMRDTAEVLGISHQRVSQLTQTHGARGRIVLRRGELLHTAEPSAVARGRL